MAATDLDWPGPAQMDHGDRYKVVKSAVKRRSD